MFLTVLGSGSFSLAGAPIWRGPRSYEVAPRFVDELLDHLEANPQHASWLIVSEFDPNYVPPEPPTGTLRPEDLAWNARPTPATEPEPAPLVDPQGLPLDFPCVHCPRSFPSEGSRERHAEFEHANIHAENLDALRAAHVQDLAARAEQDRIRAYAGEPQPLGESANPPLAPWNREQAAPPPQEPRQM